MARWIVLVAVTLVAGGAWGQQKPRNPKGSGSTDPHVAKSVDDRYKQARLLVQRGHVSKARALLELEMKAGHATAPIHALMGIILLGRPYLDKKAARAEFAKALQDDPTNLDANYGMASLLIQTGEYAASLRRLAIVLKQQPKYRDAHRLAGTALYQLSRFEEAERELRLAGPLPEAIEYRALILGRKKRYVEAARMIEALRKLPNLPRGEIPRLLFQQAALLILATDSKAARPLLEQSIQTGFERAEVLNELGKIYYDAGEIDKARAVYERATKAPSIHGKKKSARTANALAWYQLGLIAYNKKQYAEAETALLRAIELDKYHEHAWYKLGQTLMRLKRREEAKQAFAFHKGIQPKLQLVKSIERSLVNNPDDVKTRWGLVQLLIALERDEKALAELRTIEVRDPSWPGLYEAMAQVCARLGRGDLAKSYRAKIKKRPGGR